jgi:hypothetical protein
MFKHDPFLYSTIKYETNRIIFYYSLAGSTG